MYTSPLSSLNKRSEMDNKEVEELAKLFRNHNKNKRECIDGIDGKDCFGCLAQIAIKFGYHKVEPVQLEVLGERGIKNTLEDIQPEGFYWGTMTKTEIFKFKAISQATIDQYPNLYRRVE
jgi:hypothetical protein